MSLNPDTVHCSSSSIHIPGRNIGSWERYITASNFDTRKIAGVRVENRRITIGIHLVPLRKQKQNSASNPPWDSGGRQRLPLSAVSLLGEGEMGAAAVAAKVWYSPRSISELLFGRFWRRIWLQYSIKMDYQMKPCEAPF